MAIVDHGTQSEPCYVLYDNNYSLYPLSADAQSKLFGHEIHIPTSKSMQNVQWNVRKLLPNDDELRKRAFTYMSGISDCDLCWSIEGKQTTCTSCLSLLRGNQDIVQYLTFLKCSTEKMRLKNNDMYECYLMTTFMKREEQDTLMGLFPIPRLPR